MEKTVKVSNRPYEAVIIMHPDSSLEEQKDLFKKNRETIKSYGGQVVSLDTWGKRTLASEIGKVRKGIYFHTTFEAAPATIMELERTMRINDKVLRFMHTRLDERVPLAKYLEGFKKSIKESAEREKEREAKAQMRRAAANAERGFGGDRGFGGGERSFGGGERGFGGGDRSFGGGEKA